MKRSYSTAGKVLFVLFVTISFPSELFSGSQFTSVTTTTFGPLQTATRSWGNPIWGNLNSNTDNGPNPNLDLIVPTNSQDPLIYLNNGNGTFTQLTTGVGGNSGIYLPAGYGTDWRGFAFGDYDGDGKLDLYIAVNWMQPDPPSKSNLLFKGTGGPPNSTTYFTLVSGTGIALDNDSYQGQSGFWVDTNRNGNLELFVKNYFAGSIPGVNHLYEYSSGMFTDLLLPSTYLQLAVHQDFATPQNGHGVLCSFTDTRYNGDMNVAFSSFRKAFYYKDPNGDPYKELTDPTGKSIVPIDGEICLGLAWGDYNNDSWPDLYIASGTLNANDCNPQLSSCLRTYLFKNNGDGTFTDVTADAGVFTKANTWSPIWGDYDNDGYLDLFVTCSDAGPGSGTQGNANLLYHNKGPNAQGKYTFELVNDPVIQMNDHVSLHKTAAWADYDNNGFLDLIVKDGNGSVMDTAKLVRNNGNNNHWIEIYLQGLAPGQSTGSNRNGIGARVQVTYTPTGGQRTAYRVNNGGGGGEYSSQGSEPLHFGLKDATTATVSVTWPNGRQNPATSYNWGNIITITEPTQ